MENLLVAWIDEDPLKFTVMSRKDMTDGTMRLLESAKLLHKVVTFNWNKRIVRGKILRFGDKTALERDLLNESSSRRRPDLKRSAAPLQAKDGQSKVQRWEKIVADATGIRKNLGQSLVLENNPGTQSGPEAPSQSYDYLKKKYNELKGKYVSLEKTLKILQDDHKKCSEGIQPREVDIGNSIKVDAAVLSALKILSSKRNFFARNLFRAVFTTDEVVGRSLTGKRCNANRQSEILPTVDESKRDAVIAYSLSVYRLQPGTELYELAKQSMKHSLSNLVTEMNTEAKKQEESLQQAGDL